MPQEHPIIYSIAALVLLAIALLRLARMREDAIDARHGITMSDGRAGTLEYRSADHVADFYWEMLVGEFDFDIDVRDLSWRLPIQRAFTPTEKQAFFAVLRAWAIERRFKYVLIPRDADNSANVA